MAGQEGRALPRHRGLTAPLLSLSIQDIAILFNVIIIFLMFFNTFVFQAGLVNLLFHKFKGTILLSAAYLALSISFHVWVMVGWGLPASPKGTRAAATTPCCLLSLSQERQGTVSHCWGCFGVPPSLFIPQGFPACPLP